MASIGELFVELGVFADTKELEQFNNKLKKVNSNIKVLQRELKTAAVAITAAFYAINKLTNSLIASNQEFLNLTRNSDIALGTFQKWNNVGRMLGVKNAAQQLAGLNQRLYELKLTGQGAEGFILAGINPLGQDAEGIMEQLRNRVAGLDDTSATFLLNRMGLDPSMLHLLRMTREEFEELGRTVKKYQLTEQQRKQIQVFNRQLEIARIKLEYLKDRVILKLLPLFVQLMHNLFGVSNLLKDIVKTIERIPALKNTLIGIGAVLLAAFHPFIAFFTGLFLILDDINHYVNGGGSMIGVFMKAFHDFQNDGFFSDNVPKWIQVLAEAAANLKEWWDSFLWSQDAKDFNERMNTQVLKDLTPEQIEKIRERSTDEAIKNMVTPASLNGINQSLDNSKSFNTNQNTTIHQTNNINTTQPVQDINNQLSYLQNAYAAG